MSTDILQDNIGVIQAKKYIYGKFLWTIGFIIGIVIAILTNVIINFGIGIIVMIIPVVGQALFIIFLAILVIILIVLAIFFVLLILWQIVHYFIGMVVSVIYAGIKYQDDPDLSKYLIKLMVAGFMSWSFYRNY